MEKTVSLNDYKSNQIFRRQNVSTIDMIFNPVKRKKTSMQILIKTIQK